MYGQVWTWAGKYRHTEVNIGDCPPAEIPVRLEQVLGNLEYQAATGTPDPLDLCVDYHQAITQIHPFVNGNGRHARITTMKLGEALGMSVDDFTWGLTRIKDLKERRRAYLEALRAADGGDPAALAHFLVN